MDGNLLFWCASLLLFFVVVPLLFGRLIVVCLFSGRFALSKIYFSQKLIRQAFLEAQHMSEKYTDNTVNKGLSENNTDKTQEYPCLKYLHTRV